MKDLKTEVAKPRKVALYQHMRHEWVSVWEVDYTDRDEHYNVLPNGELREEPRYDYVRISAPVPVEFESISQDEIVGRAVEALNQEERKIVEELNKKLSDIRGRKNQLLALSHQPEPVEG